MAATVVAAADVGVALATPGNTLGIPVVPEGSRIPMLAYGAFLLAIALWAIATAARSAPRQPAAVPVPEPSVEDEATLLHLLREYGWYVADDIRLPHADIDHVAIGPAGVLAVQRMWTNRPDGRGKPAARARIAAHQLRHELAVRELDVEVVPALLAFGPGQAQAPGGVRVVDSVAVLFADQARQWMAELSRRELLSERVVAGVREVVGGIREGAEPLGLAALVG